MRVLHVDANQKWGMRMLFRLSIHSIYCYLLTILCCTCCFAAPSNSLDLESLIFRINQAREEIKSGELRVLLTDHRKARGTPKEIEQWIQDRIERRLADAIDHGGSEAELPHLRQRFGKESQILSAMDRAHTQVREINVCFEIDDINSEDIARTYRYRQYVADLTVWDVEDTVGVFRYDPQISFYDDGILAVGVEMPSQLAMGLLSEDKSYLGFRNYQLFGRSSYYLSIDRIKSVKQETLGESQYYVLTVQPDENASDAFTTMCRIWVNQTNYWVVKEEYFHPQTKAVAKTIKYEEFREFPSQTGQIWYPIRCVLSTPYKNRITTNFEIIEIDFNVDFPPNFFSIDLEKIDGGINSGDINLNLTSDIKLSTKTPSLSLDTLTTDSDYPTDVECGPKSLFMICQLLNVSATYDEILSLCPADPHQGVSLLRLHQAATTKGLKPTGLRMKTLKQLQTIQFPAIAHLAYGHFFVIRGVEDNQLNISDPSGFYTSPMDFENFENLWDGYILTFEKSESIPITATSSPFEHSVRQTITKQWVGRSFFKETQHDFGTAIGGDQIKHQFEFVNQSQDVLVIENISTSCHCTAASLLNTDGIPVGGREVIEVTLDVPKTNGKVEETIYVRTNHPQYPRFELTLIGHAHIPVVAEPSHIVIGKTKLTQVKEVIVNLNIRDPSDIDQVKIVDITPSSSHIDVVFQSRSPSLEGSNTLLVTLHPELPVGNLREAVDVKYIYQSREINLNIPIIGEIVGDFLVSPQRLFLGLIKTNEPLSRKITVSRIEGNDRKALSVKADSSAIRAKILEQKDEKIIIEVIADPLSLSEGEFRNMVTIYTNSNHQKEIRVQVYGIVRKNSHIPK